MAKIRLTEIPGLSSNNRLNSIELKLFFNLGDTSLAVLRNNREKILFRIVNNILNSHIVQPLEALINFDDKRLAYSYSEKLINTKDLPDAETEIHKFKHLSREQKVLLREYMMLIYQVGKNKEIFKNISIHPNKALTSKELKGLVKFVANFILLYLLNYLHQAGRRPLNINDYKRFHKYFGETYYLAYCTPGMYKKIYISDKIKKDNNLNILTALLDALKNRNIEEIKNFFFGFADKTLSDVMKEMLLIISILDNNIESIKTLLAHKEYLGIKDDSLGNVLVVAAYTGNAELINLFPRYGISLNIKNDQGITPLTYVALIGDKKMAVFLLECKAEPDFTDKYNRTALIWAAELGHYDIIQLLLKHNAELEVRDVFQDTALIIAAREGHYNIVKLLLKYGANPNALNNNMYTALMYAAKHGYANIVDILLKLRANPNMQEEGGETALSYAVRNGYKSIISSLLAYGANPNIQICDNKFTPLILACSKRYKDIAKMLLEYKANPNIQDVCGATALTWATCDGSTEIVEILLDHHADPNTQTQTLDKEAPLHFAVQYNYEI